MTSLKFFRNTEDAELFTEGQTIFSEGDSGSFMCVVIEGEVNIVVRDKVIGTLNPGDIFGEMALIEERPRSASAIAKTDSKILAINEKRFTFLVSNTPFFALHVMRVMAERLRHMDSLV